MKEITTFLQKHNTLTLATERNHEVFAAALFYVSVDNGKALIFVSNPQSDHIKNIENNKKCAATIQENNLDAAELTLRYAEEDFMQSGNETSYYFLFSLLRDKKFPQFASASITLDISDLPKCAIENSVFKIFINDGPLIPLAISQNNSSEVVHKITNANSPIPGFDISSAFMNESTLRIISKVICENDDIFEANRLFKLSKNDVNVTYKIPSNQWLIALK